MKTTAYRPIVRYWILLGVAMLIVQVVVGGITRLTESGLSITRWDIVTGTLPPLSEEAWQQEFDLYKATPQYEEINEGMELGSIMESGTFKFIYFWEWVHRLWARVMGIVFLIPFIYFWARGYLDTMLRRRLIGVFLLAGLAASFGWIMVRSGLIERPWVNAYKLTLHLSIALLTYAYLLWTYYKVVMPHIPSQNFGASLRFRSLAKIFTTVLCVQIFVGGIMSGMKAGVVYPTFPDMRGEFIPHLLFNSESWSVENFNYYDRHPFMAALIQSLHRLLAYSVLVLGIYYVTKVIRAGYTQRQTWGSILLISFILCQVCVGILTVINCQGSIPLGLGVLHQFLALCLLSVALYLNYLFARREPAGLHEHQRNT